MLRARVDDSLMRSKLRRMEAAVNLERVVALSDGVGQVIMRVTEIAPRDTARYVRGWSEAGTGALKRRFPMPPLQASKRGEEIRARLLEQFKKWDFFVRRYEQNNRRDRHYNKAIRVREAAIREIIKFSRGGETSIAFDLYDWQRASSGRNLTTIRNKVYGGTGRMLVLKDQVFIELHNLEPHTTIVERNHRVLARAGREFKGTGVRRYGRKFITGVARRSGFTATSGF